MRSVIFFLNRYVMMSMKMHPREKMSAGLESFSWRVFALGTSNWRSGSGGGGGARRGGSGMLSNGPCRFLFQLLPDLGDGWSLAGGGDGESVSLDLVLLSEFEDENGLVLDLEINAPCESTLKVEPADIVDPDAVESMEPFRCSEDLFRR